MRRCEKESSDGELSFISSVSFFVVVCGKVQKAEGPTRKLAGEPVQGYGRDYELLIGFFVDQFDGFYLTCFYKRNFQDEEDEVLSFGGQKLVLV